MLRRAAVFAAGLSMAAGFGLAGVGTASAVTPANHITSGHYWTIEVNGGGCEQDLMAASTFTTPNDPQYNGDAGKYSQTATTVKMKWTAGNDAGLKFKGTYQSAGHEFVGSFGGIGAGDTGQLVKGAVAGC